MPDVASRAARAYAPRIALRWLAEEPGVRHRRVDGSLLFADISGFTRLSERLAARGRVGAEEVVGLVGRVMTVLVGELERWGGDVGVFAGDALIVLFEGEGSAERAARAAAEVRAWFAANGTVRTSVGRVTLRVSIGVATGPVDLVLAGDADRKLFLVGPTTTSVVAMEREAVAGEVMLDAATAAALDPGQLREGRAGGTLLRRVVPPARVVGAPPAPDEVDARSLVAAPLRPYLDASTAPESEHRQATIAFVLAGGLDARLAPADPGPPADAGPRADPGAPADPGPHADPGVPGGPGADARPDPGADADLASGSDAVASADAVAGAVADLDAWFRAACDAGTRHGVTVLDTDVTADGATLFLAAGAPTATGDEEERMLRALRDILAMPEAARLRLRAGVNRGPVFAGDLGAPHRRTYTAMGDTTNLAARLAHRAAPGQLLATADVLTRSATEFSSSALDPFSAKGKREPVTPYLVGPPAGTRTRVAAALPLAGRASELATLRAVLAGAAAGRGGVVEIVGEPGAGKSRLLAELLDDRSIAGRLVVRCSTSDAATPYAAVRAALRELAGIPPDAGPDEAGERLAAWAADMLPDAAPWLPLVAIPFGAAVAATAAVDDLAPSFRRTRLLAEVARLVEAALPPSSLVVVEDAHWADDASLSLLGELAATPGAARRALVVARRPGPPPLAVAPVARIELEGLPEAAVVRLALDAAGRALSDADLAGIVDRAGGNPLFARELAEVVAASGSGERLPERLESLVASRIDRLEPRRRRLLRRAAVLGRSVDLGLLAEALDDDPDVRDLRLWGELDEFVAFDGPARLRFRHDLVRDAAYEGLSHARRQELHLSLAQALERRADGGTDPVAAQLATHFAEGGLPGPAFRYARRAGDLARAQYANVDAAALYRRALEAAGRLRDQAPEETAAVAEALGDVAELAGRYDEATHAYERAILVRRRGGPAAAGPLDLARLVRKRGIVRERQGRYDQAIRWFARGRSLLGVGDPTRVGRRGRRGGTDALPDVMTSPLGPDGDALANRLLGDIAAVRYRQGRYALCVADLLPVLEPARRAGHRDVLARAYFVLHAAYGDLGSPEVARYRDLALPIYEELGDLVGQGNVLNNLGIEAYFEGRWDDALALYRRSRDAKQRAGDIANAATQSNNEAEILSDQGRLDEAEALLRDALRVWSAAGYSIGVALATSNLGRAAARAGRHEEALERLEAAAAAFARIGAAGYVDETRARIAECLALAGRAAEARTVARETLARVRSEAEHSVLAAQLERTLAWADLLEGDAASARAHAADSLADARALGAAFEAALTLRTAAAVPGEPAADRDAWRAEAAAILDGLGVIATPPVPAPGDDLVTTARGGRPAT